jgi:hypothetical protein
MFDSPAMPTRSWTSFARAHRPQGRSPRESATEASACSTVISGLDCRASFEIWRRPPRGRSRQKMTLRSMPGGGSAHDQRMYAWIHGHVCIENGGRLPFPCSSRTRARGPFRPSPHCLSTNVPLASYNWKCGLDV